VVLRGRGASFYIQNDYKCARCKELNASDARYCGRCSLPLELEAALMEREVRGEVDRGMDALFRDSEFRAFVAKKISELSPS